MEGRIGRDRKPNFVGYGEVGERGRDKKPNFVACSASIVSEWVDVAWNKKSYLGLPGNTCFVCLALRRRALSMGQTG